MKQITDCPVTFQVAGRTLRAKAEKICLGSQYDHLALRLVFRRPEQLAKARMLLLFEDSVKQYTPVDVGAGEEYILPNTLTQQLELRLQAAFQEGERVLHSNQILFSLRPSSRGGEEAVAPWPMPPMGKDGHSPKIGPSGCWLVWDEDREEYVDSGLPSRGEAGPQGEPGLAGENGKDGLTVSVNGVAQKEGNIVLTAAEIPYGSGSGQSVGEMLNRKRLAVAGNPILTALPENWIESIAVHGATVRIPDQEPTPDRPVALSGVKNPAVQVSGRNLLPNHVQSGTANGVKVERDPDGTLHFSGTATSRTTFYLTVPPYRLPLAQVTLSLNNNRVVPGASIGLDVSGISTPYLAACDSLAKKMGIDGGSATAINQAAVRMEAGANVDGLIIRPMLNLGDTALPYEPYAGNLYTWQTAPLHGDSSLRDEISTAGTLSRHWGVKILDGLETWYMYGSKLPTGLTRYRLNNAIFSDASRPASNAVNSRMLASHHVSIPADTLAASPRPAMTYTAVGELVISGPQETVSAFTTWVAAQHAAGTPVTIVYPLAQRKTETFQPFLTENPAGEVVVSGPGELALTTTRLASLREVQARVSEILEKLA